MSVRIMRPGQKILTIGNPGLQVISPRGGAPAVPWYLAGGVSAANCIAAYQPIGAASLAASLVNIVNPGTYDATYTNAPGQSAANGWEFDATNKRIDVGVTVTDSHSIFIRMSVLGYGGSNYGRLMELSSSDLTIIIPWDWASRREYRWGNTSKLIASITEAYSAVIGIDKSYGWLSGSSEIAIGGTLDPSGTLYLGNNGASNRGFNGYIQAAVIYDTAITSDQVAAISAAMNAL